MNQKDLTSAATKAWLCLFVVSLLLALAACGGASATTSAPTTTTPSSGNSISIAQFAFTPNSLTVKVGTKVTWTNNDSATHTVTADQGAFNSGALAPGSGFSFTLSKAGTFSYHCSIHPSMTATIIVQ